METMPSSRCSLSAKQGCRGIVSSSEVGDGRTLSGVPYLKVSSNSVSGFGGKGSSTCTLSFAYGK